MYVDDTKISHKDSTKRGKYHTFVGMGIEFKDNGTVELAMDEHIDACVKIDVSQNLKE